MVTLPYTLLKWQLRLSRFNQALNQAIDRSQGYLLAAQALQTNSFADFSHYYGEMEQASLLYLLKKTNPKPHEHFLDLGSGAGLPVLWVAASNSFASVQGLELIPSLHELAGTNAKTLVHLAGSYHRLISSHSFHCADFLTHDWSNVEVVLLNATCFIGELWEKLQTSLHLLSPGARLILISKQLNNSDSFTLLHEGQYPMSWGYAMARVYLKI